MGKSFQWHICTETKASCCSALEGGRLVAMAWSWRRSRVQVRLWDKGWVVRSHPLGWSFLDFHEAWQVIQKCLLPAGNVCLNAALPAILLKLEFLRDSTKPMSLSVLSFQVGSPDNDTNSVSQAKFPCHLLEAVHKKWTSLRARYYQCFCSEINLLIEEVISC